MLWNRREQADVCKSRLEPIDGVMATALCW